MNQAKKTNKEKIMSSANTNLANVSTDDGVLVVELVENGYLVTGSRECMVTIVDGEDEDGFDLEKRVQEKREAEYLVGFYEDQAYQAMHNTIIELYYDDYETGAILFDVWWKQMCLAGFPRSPSHACGAGPSPSAARTPASGS